MEIQIQHYAFAFFIAGLICLIAILCKVLFSNVKRQQKLLDEKESRILQLYVSVENLTEEFNDLARTTMEELKEYENRAISRMSVNALPSEFQKIEQVLDRLPKSVPLDANRMRATGEIIERTDRMAVSDTPLVVPPPQQVVKPIAPAPPIPPPMQTIQQNTYTPPKPYSPPKADNSGAVFQKMFDDTVEAQSPAPSNAAENGAESRSEKILAMVAEGKDNIQIASELGITRNEVAFVVGLKK